MSNIVPLADESLASLPGTRAQNTGSIMGDWLGIIASIGCAIHCAAMPFVIAFLPMFGLSFLADEYFHKAMFGVCTLLALVAFVPGWRRHRKWLPVGVAAFGLSFIGVAAFALEDSCCSTCADKTTVSETQATSACTDENCEHCEEQVVVECTDENCEHCEVQVTDACTDENCEQCGTSTIQANEESNSPMRAMIPWVTPLGGILLVSAHLINRRFSCLCGCCPTDATAPSK